MIIICPTPFRVGRRGVRKHRLPRWPAWTWKNDPLKLAFGGRTHHSQDCLTWLLLVHIRLGVKGVLVIPNMAKPPASAFVAVCFTFLETFSFHGCQIPSVQFTAKKSWPESHFPLRDLRGDRRILREQAIDSV